MKYTKYLYLILFCLAVFGFTGCSTGTSSDIQVRIGYFPNITHAQAMVMKSTKSLNKAVGDSVSVSWQSFNSGSAEVLSLFAGKIDIGYIGPGPAVNAYSKSNGDFLVIAGASNYGSVLLTGADTNISSIEDLSGCKIAVPGLGNTQHLCLLKLLSDAGLDTTDNNGTVDIVQSNNADIVTLLENKEIDAAIMPEPWGTIMEQQIHAKVLVDYDTIWGDSEYPVGLVIVSKDFLEHHPDLVADFLQAHKAATDYVNENREDTIEIVQDEIERVTQKRYDSEVLEASFEKIEFTDTITYEPLRIFGEISLEQSMIRKIPDESILYQTGGNE